MDVFITSPSEAVDAFENLSEGNEFACVTAQPEAFVAYHEIAKQILLQKDPFFDPDKVVLRYPTKNFPANKGELFRRFKPVADFDTKCSALGKYLIAASPSLDQKEENESAWGIFVKPERGDLEIDSWLKSILIQEGVPFKAFADDLYPLIDELPTSGLGGVLTVITAEDNSDVADFVYDSLPYGLPGNDPLNPQLRLLAAPLLGSYGVKMHRVLLIEQTAMKAYAQKVEQVVAQIFNRRDASLAELDRMIKERAAPEAIAAKYLEHFDPERTFLWALKCDEKVRYEFFKAIVLLLIELNELDKAREILLKIPVGYSEKNKLLAMLAIAFLDLRMNERALVRVLDQMPNGNEKNMVLLFARAFTDKKDEYRPDPRYIQDLDEGWELLDFSLEDWIERFNDSILDASAARQEILT